jgi:hypothetical protein
VITIADLGDHDGPILAITMGGIRIHASAVAEVLYRRHAHHLVTIITTPLNPEKAALRYGDHIGRRTFEAAEGVYVIELRAAAKLRAVPR